MGRGLCRREANIKTRRESHLADTLPLHECRYCRRATTTPQTPSFTGRGMFFPPIANGWAGECKCLTRAGPNQPNRWCRSREQTHAMSQRRDRKRRLEHASRSKIAWTCRHVSGAYTHCSAELTSPRFEPPPLVRAFESLFVRQTISRWDCYTCRVRFNGTELWG